MSEKTDKDFAGKLFINYRQTMFKTAKSILLNNSNAEDAVQEAFLHIINNLEKISKLSAVGREHYIIKIVKNVCYDWIRHESRRPVENIDEFEISTGNYVEDEALSKLTVDEIKSTLNELSERDRDILYLLLFKDYAPKEVAKSLGISERNIGMYITRARRRLIVVLKKRGITNDF